MSNDFVSPSISLYRWITLTRNPKRVVFSATSLWITRIYRYNAQLKSALLEYICAIERPVMSLL